jgi:hypothetical protein
VKHEIVYFFEKKCDRLKSNSIFAFHFKKHGNKEASYFV